MSSERDVETILPKTVAEGESIWEREKIDTDVYQWVREMRADEYDWDPEADEVSLVGTDTPIRVVSLQRHDDEWHVEAAETAGPEYHRPGFTELISSEYSYASADLTDAAEKVREYISRLS